MKWLGLIVLVIVGVVVAGIAVVSLSGAGRIRIEDVTDMETARRVIQLSRSHPAELSAVLDGCAQVVAATAKMTPGAWTLLSESQKITNATELRACRLLTAAVRDLSTPTPQYGSGLRPPR